MYLDYEIQRAGGDRKTLAPHREVETLMSRALNQFIMFFYDFRAHGKSSRAESRRMKARTARLPARGG